MALADMNAYRRAISLQQLQARLQGLEGNEFDANVRDFRSMRSPIQRSLPMFGTDLAGERDYFARTNRQGEIGQIRDLLQGGTGRLNVRQGHSVTQGSDWLAEQDERAAEKAMAEQQRQSIDALGAKAFNAPVGGNMGDLNYAMYKKALAEAEAAREKAETDAFSAKVTRAPELGYHQQARSGAYDREENAADFDQKLFQQGEAFEQQTGQMLDRDRALEFDPVQAQIRERKERMTLGPAQARAEGTIATAREKSRGQVLAAIANSAGRIGAANAQGLTRFASSIDMMDPAFDEKIGRVQQAINEMAQTSIEGVRGDRSAVDGSARAFDEQNTETSFGVPGPSGTPTVNTAITVTPQELEAQYYQSGVYQRMSLDDFVARLKRARPNLQIVER